MKRRSANPRPHASSGPARKPPTRPSLRAGLRSIGLLGLLLVLPGWAIVLLVERLETLLPVAALAVVWVITFFRLRTDKQRAQAGAPRVPERHLHLLELMGGWPASFVAQRIYRHKTIKLPYQWTFRAIITLHQIVALDFIRDWAWTRALWFALRPLLAT